MSIALLTGATGSVGIHLLAELGAAGRFSRVYCLVRARAEQSGMARLERHAALHGIALSGQVCVIHGDIRRPNLGLSDEDYDRLCREVTHVFHCAADVRFNQPLDVMRRVNVEGTRSVLDLCARAQARDRFVCLAHVGTAFVAGRKRSVVGEKVLDDKRGFKNSYEQSKFEAEQLVRSRRHEVRSIIFRPSIVWCVDHQGRMPIKSTAYPAIKLYQKWPLPAIPVYRNTLDIVPVEFVAAAIARLGTDPANIGRSFHLAAGPGGDLSLNRFYKLLARAFDDAGLEKRMVRLPPWAWRLYFPFQRQTFTDKIRSAASWHAYLPYIRQQNPRFSVKNTQAALKRYAIEIPTSEAVVRQTIARVAAGLVQAES